MKYFHRATNKLKPAIGISSCLMGEAVRYDGADKLNTLIRQHFTGRAVLLPFCPEVAAGMGIPRAPIHLVNTSKGPAALDIVDATKNYTRPLQRATEHQGHVMASLNVSGYIFKARSPSCGVGNTPIHAEDNSVIDSGDGIAAATIKNTFAGLPMATEDALHDEHHCDRFVALCKLYYELTYTNHAGLALWHLHYKSQGVPVFQSEALAKASRKNDTEAYWQILLDTWNK